MHPTSAIQEPTDVSWRSICRQSAQCGGPAAKQASHVGRHQCIKKSRLNQYELPEIRDFHPIADPTPPGE
jgi:hypothetical protein